MHGPAIDTLYVIVDEKKFKNADPTLNPNAYAHSDNVRSTVLKIELVGDDVGDAGYSAYGDTTTDTVGPYYWMVLLVRRVWFLLQGVLGGNRFLRQPQRVPLMFGLS